MLDLHLFRSEQGGEPELMRESQRRRGADVQLVDRILQLDERWRAAQRQLTQLQRTKAAAQRQRLPTGSTEKPADEATAAASASRVAAPELPNRSELAALLRSAEADEKALKVELTTSLLEVGVLVHEHAPVGTKAALPAIAAAAAAAISELVASGHAERCAAVALGWRPSGQGILLQQAILCHSLAVAAAAGYTLLPTPLRPAAARVAQLGKTCRARGELGDASNSGLPMDLRDSMELDPLSALHAGDWLQPKVLPLRYACVVRLGSATGSGDEGTEELWLHEVWPDDGSVWEALNGAVTLAQELHEGLGLIASRREVSTAQLGHSEARAFVVLGGGGAIELARATCAADFRARRLGIRCGIKQLNERNKRFVHSLSARLCCPSQALLALGEARASSRSGTPLLGSLPEPLAKLVQRPSFV